MVPMYGEDRQAHMEPIAVKVCLPAMSEGVISFVLCPLLRSQEHHTLDRGRTVHPSLVHYLPKGGPVQLSRFCRLPDQESLWP